MNKSPQDTELVKSLKDFMKDLSISIKSDLIPLLPAALLLGKYLKYYTKKANEILKDINVPPIEPTMSIEDANFLASFLAEISNSTGAELDAIACTDDDRCKIYFYVGDIPKPQDSFFKKRMKWYKDIIVPHEVAHLMADAIVAKNIARNKNWIKSEDYEPHGNLWKHMAKQLGTKEIAEGTVVPK